MNQATPAEFRSFGDQSLKYFVREHTQTPDKAIDSPTAWLGKDLLARPETWRRQLTVAQIDELERGLDELEVASTPLAQIDRERVHLPRLNQAASEWRESLARGLGFLLLEGLPVASWSVPRAETAFWLLGHLVGVPGAQNAQEELLGHVRDYGEKSTDPNARLYRTPKEIGFHCDAADVVGLMCLQTAAEGGASRIASSVAIWNELLRTHPESARLLFEPFAVDRRDEQPQGHRPFFEMPPCRFGPDRVLRTFYHSEYFRSVERLEEFGKLSPERHEALDRYDAIGHDPRFRLDMELSRGDVQLLSNHSIVHARTGYQDKQESPRHLLRLWLSLP